LKAVVKPTDENVGKNPFTTAKGISNEDDKEDDDIPSLTETDDEEENNNNNNNNKPKKKQKKEQQEQQGQQGQQTKKQTNQKKQKQTKKQTNQKTKKQTNQQKQTNKLTNQQQLYKKYGDRKKKIRVKDLLHPDSQSKAQKVIDTIFEAMNVKRYDERANENYTYTIKNNLVTPIQLTNKLKSNIKNIGLESKEEWEKAHELLVQGIKTDKKTGNPVKLPEQLWKMERQEVIVEWLKERKIKGLILPEPNTKKLVLNGGQRKKNKKETQKY